MNRRLRNAMNRALIIAPCVLVPMVAIAEPNKAGQGTPRDRGLTMLALATPVSGAAADERLSKNGSAALVARPALEAPDPLGLKLLIHRVTVGQ